MIDKIYVYEDIISKDKQDLLENYFLKDTLSWKKINNTSFLDFDLPQRVISPDKIHKDIQPIISEIESNVALNLNTIVQKNYRYKVNLLKSEDYYETRNNKQSLHIDRYEEHISIVYYINNSCGDTKFYNLNGEVNHWMNYISNEEYDRFVEFKSVSPKKGKVVVFNGLIPHHSTYPKKGDRYVINFNTVIKTKPKSLF